MGQEEVDLQRDVDLVLPQCYSDGTSPIGSPSTSPVYSKQAFFIAQGTSQMEKGVELPKLGTSAMQRGVESPAQGTFEVNVVKEPPVEEKCCEVTREKRGQGISDCDTSLADDHLIMQAQILLTKNILYQKISLARQQLIVFPSVIYQTLPRSVDNDRSSSTAILTSLHRDASVNSLRFLNIFCNCSPSTFFLAAGLLDRLISTVQVHPWYMASISTCCFYLAAKTCEPRERIPDPSELLKLSRCADNLKDFHVTERRILETLRGNAASVTALTFLEHFYNVFKLYLGGLYRSIECDGCASIPPTCDDRSCHERSVSKLETGNGFNEQAFAALAAKLEVLVCQFEFSQFRGDVLALALLSYDLQERGILSHPDQFALVVELQYYCQISDIEFIQCRGLVIEYLAMYHQQPTKLPRLQLAWSISRRTLHKMKPSTRASQDLEPILEDEPLSSPIVTDEDTDDDSGPFDSECDDLDMRVGTDELTLDSILQYREYTAADAFDSTSEIIGGSMGNSAAADDTDPNVAVGARNDVAHLDPDSSAADAYADAGYSDDASSGGRDAAADDVTGASDGGVSDDATFGASDGGASDGGASDNATFGATVAGTVDAADAGDVDADSTGATAGPSYAVAVGGYISAADDGGYSLGSANTPSTYSEMKSKPRVILNASC